MAHVCPRGRVFVRVCALARARLVCHLEQVLEFDKVLFCFVGLAVVVPAMLCPAGRAAQTNQQGSKRPNKQKGKKKTRRGRKRGESRLQGYRIVEEKKVVVLHLDRLAIRTARPHACARACASARAGSHTRKRTRTPAQRAHAGGRMPACVLEIVEPRERYR